MKNNKIIVLILLIIMIINNTVYASNNDVLSKIENNFFGFDYTNDTTQNRVSRLEKTIYGKASAGDINKRITRLSGDISADVIGLEIEPTKDTFIAEENSNEDNSVNYPVIDEIEQKLFNKINKNLDLHSRIVKIEKKLFGKIYDVDDYSKRMDRIKEKLYPERTAYNTEDNYGDEYNNHKVINTQELSGLNQSWFKMPFGQRKYTRPYTNYGEYQSIDDAIVEDKYNLNDNLSQMEYDMFGTEFSNDDTQTRIKRLNSANKARKSTRKYDSQKFQQRMSTAMEIGAMILMILAMVL